jgi:hypothetical protein
MTVINQSIVTEFLKQKLVMTIISQSINQDQYSTVGTVRFSSLFLEFLVVPVPSTHLCEGIWIQCAVFI